MMASPSKSCTLDKKNKIHILFPMQKVVAVLHQTFEFYILGTDGDIVTFRYSVFFVFLDDSSISYMI